MYYEDLRSICNHFLCLFGFLPKSIRKTCFFVQTSLSFHNQGFEFRSKVSLPTPYQNSNFDLHFQLLVRMQSFISELIFLFEFEFEALLLNSYSIRIQNFVSGLLFKFKTSFRVGRTILIRIYCGFLLECKFDYYTISKFRFQILIRIRISLGFRLRIRKWSFEFEFEQLVGNQALNLDSNKN